MGGYEKFKFENSLISSIYPTSPLDYDSSNTPTTEKMAQREMMRTVAERGKYFYTYAEYTFSRLFRLLCCCCDRTPWLVRRLKKLERHEEASKKLA